MLFDKWRALATAVIVLAVYFLEPSFFSEAINAAFWLLVSFFLAGFLTSSLRRFALRRLIAFDMSGVLTSGDPFIEELKPDPKMFDLVKRLRKKNRVALWSNTPVASIQYLESQFDLRRLFDYVVFPKTTKAKKPDKAFFEGALKECGVNAGNVIFIDDDENNVKTARSVDINAIHFKSYEQLIEALKAYGISV
jgi:HAD superfamily hydrolase (TIGR01509 family)